MICFFVIWWYWPISNLTSDNLSRHLARLNLTPRQIVQLHNFKDVKYFYTKQINSYLLKVHFFIKLKTFERIEYLKDMKLQKMQSILLFENQFIILKWNIWNTFILTQWHRNNFVSKRKWKLNQFKRKCKFTIEEFYFNFYRFPTLWRTHCFDMLSLLSPSLWVP